MAARSNVQYDWIYMIELPTFTRFFSFICVRYITYIYEFTQIFVD